MPSTEHKFNHKSEKWPHPRSIQSPQDACVVILTFGPLKAKPLKLDVSNGQNQHHSWIRQSQPIWRTKYYYFQHQKTEIANSNIPLATDAESKVIYKKECPDIEQLGSNLLLEGVESVTFIKNEAILFQLMQCSFNFHQKIGPNTINMDHPWQPN